MRGEISRRYQEVQRTLEGEFMSAVETLLCPSSYSENMSLSRDSSVVFIRTRCRFIKQYPDVMCGVTVRVYLHSRCFLWNLADMTCHMHYTVSTVFLALIGSAMN